MLIMQSYEVKVRMSTMVDLEDLSVLMASKNSLEKSSPDELFWKTDWTFSLFRTLWMACTTRTNYFLSWSNRQCLSISGNFPLLWLCN